MKANFEDRPYTEKPKKGITKWVVFSALAIVIVGGLLGLNKNKAAIIFQEPTAQPSAINELLEQNTDNVERNFPTEKTKKAASAAIQWEKKRDEIGQKQQKEKQTVFNDQNYIPRAPQNVMPSTTAKQITYRQPTQRIQQKQRFSKKHWVTWSWKSYGSGFSKKTKGGKFSYIETERGIDTTSVCTNYRKGSLEYRDCRKAAKKWFQDRCSNSFRQACLAGNMIP